jgi:hypothetical protein
MSDLRDLDTAFPRGDSDEADVTFSNGRVERIKTNAPPDRFAARFLGVEVHLTWWTPDEHAETATVVAIEFLGARSGLRYLASPRPPAAPAPDRSPSSEPSSRAELARNAAHTGDKH